MVFSPVFMLGWIAISARVMGDAGYNIPHDPPGYLKKIQAYGDFLEVTNRLNEYDVANPSSPQNLHLIRLALAEIEKPLPPLEDVRLNGDTASDPRQRIYTAKARTEERLRNSIEALKLEQRYEEALEIAVGMMKSAYLCRYFGFSPLASSNSTSNQAADYIKELLPKASKPRVAWVTQQLLELEGRRGDIFAMFKNDIRLIKTSTLLHSKTASVSGAVTLAQEAFDHLVKGGNLQNYLERVSFWQNNNDKDLVWSVLAGWEVSRRNELSNYKLMKDLIIESRQVERNVTFKDRESLNLPEFVFIDPLTRAGKEFR